MSIINPEDSEHVKEKKLKKLDEVLGILKGLGENYFYEEFIND